MKIIISVLFCIALLFSFAVAETADYSSMTNDQLQSVIDAAHHELFIRQVHEDGNLLIYDKNNIQIYLTGKCTISYGNAIEIGAILVNNTDRKIHIGTDACTVNGWEVYCSGLGETSPHSKKKCTFEIYLEDTDIKETAELQELMMDLQAIDAYEWTNTPLGIVKILYDGSSFSLVQ